MKKLTKTPRNLYEWLLLLSASSMFMLVLIEAIIIGGTWGSTFFFAHMFFMLLTFSVGYMYLVSLRKEGKKEECCS